jgi:hypothetical protein
MPTLKPQTLSGRVVIPTVEQEPGINRVSIAINVGHTRTGSPPLDVVNREDLVVVLSNPAEGDLEPIASPDPGPLPVRALRVAQARGEFTFAQGVGPPTNLRVTLRGDTRNFPLSQTLTPTACLKREPGEGDPFPPGGRSRPALLAPFARILQLKRGRCCVKRFEAPLNNSPDPAAKSEYFEVEGDFVARGRKCVCKCCEYRQYVRGAFTNADGATVPFDMPSGPLSATTYCGDGSTDEFGPNRHGYYGHRDTSSSGDTYGGKGCAYRGDENAGCPPAETAHLEYMGLVVDVCRRTVVEKRTWVVDL